jgi:hypothetical protein
MEGIALSDGGRSRYALDHRKPLQLHVVCFYLWDAERRQ